jgi:shikimate dehydrogenase
MFNTLPIDAEDVTKFRFIADLVYGDLGTAMATAAEQCNIPFTGGLDLLIGQGALAFELFTGQTADRAAMRSAVGTR